MTLHKILVANRGEIAVRIIRAAREAGLRAVAVYADPDAESLHVRLADEAYALEGADAAETYLDIEKLLDVARRAGVDAVHPGYGFLSESADFARAVVGAGVTWVGPDPHTIEVLGDKASARSLAERVNAPLVRGTNEPVSGPGEVVAFAEEHGLPLAIKAIHGGGGRGLRVVRELDKVADAYEAAVREATAAFGQGDCLVEQYLDRPRHIEAQVLGDRHGRVVVLGTRDCSLQRRNQKLVEEAPAPFLEPDVTTRIHEAAADICRAAGYVSAGTVEFLLGADGTLTFLEVNTRLQVEHPVTEMITGVDLVQEQFRIAAGDPMNVPETAPSFGHAIEFRINAEDPALGFLPTPGTIERFDVPGGPGVRVDSGFSAGHVVSGSFDSLLAKLVVWGRDRGQAISRAKRALDELVVDGVATVLPFDRYIVTEPAFVGTDEEFGVHTRWIEDECTEDFTAASPAQVPEEPRVLRTPLEIDGRRVEVGLPLALLAQLGTVSPPSDTVPGPEGPDEDPGSIVAPFAGTLCEWKVEDGSRVSEGESIAVLEAMKMEVPVTAPRSGVLRRMAGLGETIAAQKKLGFVEG